MADGSESILTSVKKILGIQEDYEHFDTDITLFINGAFGTLTQLGLGSDDGFSISDKSSLWTDFLSNAGILNVVREYIILRVRILFDPPTTGYLVTAFEARIKELESRLNMLREDLQWTPPVVVATPVGRVIDGGVIR